MVTKNSTTTNVARKKATKRKNRLARLAELRIQAQAENISVWELKQRMFWDAEEISKYSRSFVFSYKYGERLPEIRW